MNRKFMIITLGTFLILIAGIILTKSLKKDEIYSKEEKVNKIESTFIEGYEDEGIFSSYYSLAYEKLKTMSIDEKISQLLLVRYPDFNALETLKKNSFAGYVFYEKDFKDKTKEEVKEKMNSLQKASHIPILTAVDEEGGKVVRISSNPLLKDEPFLSSKELYKEGGLDLIKEDTLEKSKLLNSLGLNLNLAPVVDVSTTSTDYIYERSLGQNTSITSLYAKTVIEASKKTGVSYTLKHFPGYGDNADTHLGTSLDTRSYEDILNNDIPPFEAGITSGAEAIMVSHNIVASIDADNPASLSKNVHELLRDDLNFTGVIISDDLAMQAVSQTKDVALKAVKAGNDLIITTDYIEAIDSIKNGLNNKEITEEDINIKVFKILAWKYYKGLLFEYQK